MRRKENVTFWRKWGREEGGVGGQLILGRARPFPITPPISNEESVLSQFAILQIEP